MVDDDAWSVSSVFAHRRGRYALETRATPRRMQIGQVGISGYEPLRAALTCSSQGIYGNSNDQHANGNADAVAHGENYRVIVEFPSRSYQPDAKQPVNKKRDDEP